MLFPLILILALISCSASYAVSNDEHEDSIAKQTIAERTEQCDGGVLKEVCEYYLGKLEAKGCPDGMARVGCNCAVDTVRCTTLWNPVLMIHHRPLTCPCVPK